MRRRRPARPSTGARASSPSIAGDDAARASSTSSAASTPRAASTSRRSSDFEHQFALNLRTAYLIAQAALPHRSRPSGGAIVCVSSRAALQPFSGAAGYITSKAALLAFVDALAIEYRDDGVRTNAVLPTVIDTPGQPQATARRRVHDVGLARSRSPP